MNLKILVMKKGLTQLELAKKLKVHPTLVSLQINKHRLLPEKHLAGFCSELEITREDLEKAMTEEGGSNE